MKVDIHFEPKDIQKIQDVISKHRNHPLVQERIRRNLTDQPKKPSREKVWHTMVMCLLTSQQRSNPQSNVNRFLRERPFRLSLSRLQTVENVESFAYDELHRFGGIRFAGRISNHIKRNFGTLQKDEWGRLENHLLQLFEQRKLAPEPKHFKLEREAAHFINDTFLGFGPKQSRNFWQDLGLTRYEFVLDSRVNKWLKHLDFPIPISPAGLGDEEFYCFISDILREFCQRATVLPCVLDAVIFSSYEP